MVDFSVVAPASPASLEEGHVSAPMHTPSLNWGRGEEVEEGEERDEKEERNNDTTMRKLSNRACRNDENKTNVVPLWCARWGSFVLGASPVVLPALLSTMPIAILQSLTAWIGLAFEVNGGSVEDSPESVLGYFLGMFRYGSDNECSKDAGQDPPIPTCTMCTFPAIPVIITAFWMMLYLGMLWDVSLCLSKALVNRSLKKKVIFFTMSFSTVLSLGFGCLGASIPFSPFTWIQQSLWLGYFGSIVVASGLISYTWIFLPVRQMRLASQSAGENEFGARYFSRDHHIETTSDDSLQGDESSVRDDNTPARDVLLRPGESAAAAHKKGFSMESIPSLDTPRSISSVNSISRNLLPMFHQQEGGTGASASSSLPLSHEVVSYFGGPQYVAHSGTPSHTRNSSTGSILSSASQPFHLPSQIFQPRRVHLGGSGGGAGLTSPWSTAGTATPPLASTNTTPFNNNPTRSPIGSTSHWKRSRTTST